MVESDDDREDLRGHVRTEDLSETESTRPQEPDFYNAASGTFGREENKDGYIIAVRVGQDGVPEKVKWLHKEFTSSIQETKAGNPCWVITGQD